MALLLSRAPVAVSPPSPRPPPGEHLVETLIKTWCLDVDASVIVPQVAARRYQSRSTDASLARPEPTANLVELFPLHNEDDDPVAGDAVPSAVADHGGDPPAPHHDTDDVRRDFAIARRISAAVLRKIRVGVTAAVDGALAGVPNGDDPAAMSHSEGDGNNIYEVSYANTSTAAAFTWAPTPLDFVSRPLLLASPTIAPRPPMSSAVRVPPPVGAPRPSASPPAPRPQWMHQSPNTGATSMAQDHAEFPSTLSVVFNDVGSRTLPPTPAPFSPGVAPSEARMRKELQRFMTDATAALLELSRRLTQSEAAAEAATARATEAEAHQRSERLQAEHLRQELRSATRALQEARDEISAMRLGLPSMRSENSARRGLGAVSSAAAVDGDVTTAPTTATKAAHRSSTVTILIDDAMAASPPLPAAAAATPSGERDDSDEPSRSSAFVPSALSPPPVLLMFGEETISQASAMGDMESADEPSLRTLFADPLGRPIGQDSRRAASVRALSTNRLQHGEDDIGMATVNQYVMLSDLGAGCQGVVMLALDSDANALRAIKVVPRPPGVDVGGARAKQENAAKMAQLRREIAIMKRCRHKNVVRLYEVIDDPEADALYLVMQYVEKGALAKMEADGTADPVDGVTLAGYAKQLCSGLRYLHSSGIIHKDIKPENLLRGADGTVYLADFGMSAMEGAWTPPPSDGPAVFGARAAAAAGSPAFRAPELVLDAFAYSPRTSPAADALHAAAADVWALGLSLYVLLYGALPWPLDDAARYMSCVAGSTPIPFPMHNRAGAPIALYSEWTALLKSMLCRDPATRATAASSQKAAKAMMASRAIAGDVLREASTGVIMALGVTSEEEAGALSRVRSKVASRAVLRSVSDV